MPWEIPKKISLLAVAIFFLFTFFTLILDAPRICLGPEWLQGQCTAGRKGGTFSKEKGRKIYVMSYLFCPGWLVHRVNSTSITDVQMYNTSSNFSQLIHKQSHKLIVSVLFTMIYLCCPSYSILLGNAFSLIFWDWDRLVHYFFVEKDVGDPTYSMGYRTCTMYMCTNSTYCYSVVWCSYLG